MGWVPSCIFVLALFTSAAESSVVHWRRILQWRWESREFWRSAYLYVSHIVPKYFYNDVFRYSPDKVNHILCRCLRYAQSYLRMNGESLCLRHVLVLDLPMLLLARPWEGESCSCSVRVYSFLRCSSLMRNQVESSPVSTRTVFTITETFGALISRRIRGIVLIQNSGLPLDPGIGRWSYICQERFRTNYLSMAIWKHYIVLFGGFYDPGIRSENKKLVIKNVLTPVSQLSQRPLVIRYPGVQMENYWYERQRA